MRKYRDALLAGVAALALVAGTGFASAQVQPKDQNGAPKAGETHAGQSGQKSDVQAQTQGKAGQTQGKAEQTQGKAEQTQGKAEQTQGKAEQTQGKAGLSGQSENTRSSAQNENKAGQQNAQGQKGEMQRNAQGANQNLQRNGKGQQMQRNARRGEKKGANENRQNAQNFKRGEKNHRGEARNERGTARGRESTAQRERTMQGLQGNASGRMQGSNAPQGQAEVSGGNVKLSEQQRTRIRETVIDARNAPRIGHVDFDVRVGTVIPRERIHVIPVPQTLVRIEPRWRGFLYFVYEDEVVVVNPHDMRIVAVVPV